VIEFGVCLKEGDQFADFTFFFTYGDGISGFDGDAGGVIASVFETFEAFFKV